MIRLSGPGKGWRFHNYSIISCAEGRLLFLVPGLVRKGGSVGSNPPGWHRPWGFHPHTPRLKTANFGFPGAASCFVGSHPLSPELFYVSSPLGGVDSFKRSSLVDLSSVFREVWQVGMPLPGRWTTHTQKEGSCICTYTAWEHGPKTDWPKGSTSQKHLCL